MSIEEDVKALREAVARVPHLEWTYGAGVVTIPETEEDNSEGRINFRAILNKMVAPKFGAFVAAANPARIARLLSALEEAEKARRTISQADVSKAARFICDRSASECNVDKDDMWKLHGSEFAEDVTDMLKHIGFAIEAAKEG